MKKRLQLQSIELQSFVSSSSQLQGGGWIEKFTQRAKKIQEGTYLSCVECSADCPEPVKPGKGVYA